MVKNKILLITGGTGMVGKAIMRNLPGTLSAIPISSKDFDLRSQKQTQNMYEKYVPDAVIHLAAKVGGVKANSEQVADFFNENILINTNVLMEANKNNVQNVISLLSTCVYPDKDYVEYPLTEQQLHLGPPHESNFGYAYAKRMVEVQSRAFRKQYNRNYITAIPNNIFGPEDNFDLENGHVLPTIIRKIFEAKISNTAPVFWGSGNPLREFTFVDDIAKCLLKMSGESGEIEEKFYTSEMPYNIGTNKEISIKKVVYMVANILEYHGEILWDRSKPEGQFRKPSNSTNFKHKYLPLEDGLKITCKWFVENYPNVRGINKN